MEQYKLIVELCGAPDNELLGKIEAQNSAAMRSVVERMGDGRARQDFRKYFRGQPDGAIDLLDKFLVLDPDRRISVEEALTHPYVQEHHLPSDEPIAKEPFNIDDQNDAARTIEEWKEIIWNEIQDLNSQNENGEHMETE
jgi:serine/threonine protein kinase